MFLVKTKKSPGWRNIMVMLGLSLLILFINACGSAPTLESTENKGLNQVSQIPPVDSVMSQRLSLTATPTTVEHFDVSETVEVELSAIEPSTLPATIIYPSPTLNPPTPAPNYSPTPDNRPEPRQWRTWPVIPVVSQRAIDIYQQGLAMGNDPHVFSIIGDCQSEPPVFMGIYASDRYFLLPDEEYLEETIDFFQGNFDRQHATVKNGLSVASVFSPLWASKDICKPGETPLECEFRLYKPSIVFINLGTNWKNGDGFAHAEHLSEVLDFVISKGAVPIISTKGDNVEGDHSINWKTAELAYEYDIPLWNYWAAIQHLPNKGLDKERNDSNYLSVDAWSVRGYTALRSLDRVWRTVNGMEIP